MNKAAAERPNYNVQYERRKNIQHNQKQSYVNSSQLAKMKKRVFLICPCHKIYRDEAVGLKSCKYT